MKVAVLGRRFNTDFIKYIEAFFSKLGEKNMAVYVNESFSKFLNNEIHSFPEITDTYSDEAGIPEDIDFFFTIGGDGTFLEALPFVHDSAIPVIGLNTGRLGFLANISKEEISNAVDALLNENFTIEKRSLLHVEVDDEQCGFYSYALNDITIQKTDYALIEVNTSINNDYVNTYWTDGVIIATPTGSTAYSLSVGGPIITPDSANFIISPIASHNLSVRPLVIPDHVEINIRVSSRNSKYILTVDNRSSVFNHSVKLKIKKAGFNLSLVSFNECSYFNTLRNKLMWGADKRN